MPETVIVVPCYNEAHRLPKDALLAHLERDARTDFILVDDGSQDETLAVLRSIEENQPRRITVIHQETNRGKAEAVRQGMEQAFELDCQNAGYFDADLATPLHQIEPMRRVLDEDHQIEMVFGARVQLMGRQIERSRVRHYLGRVFATIASMTLGLAIYDTQCGAKLFRNIASNRKIFTEPFDGGWIFDVEILARRIAGTRWDGQPPIEGALYELPLAAWIDVAGSKVQAIDFVRASIALGKLHRRYLSTRAERWPSETDTATE